MSKDPINESGTLNSGSHKSELAQVRYLIKLMLRKKYYFLVAFIVAFTCAYIFNKCTMPTYRVSAILLIEEENKSASTDTDQLLEGFGLTSSMKNMDNQMIVLSSKNPSTNLLTRLVFPAPPFPTKSTLNI